MLPYSRSRRQIDTGLFHWNAYSDPIAHVILLCNIAVAILPTIVWALSQAVLAINFLVRLGVVIPPDSGPNFRDLGPHTHTKTPLTLNGLLLRGDLNASLVTCTTFSSYRPKYCTVDRKRRRVRYSFYTRFKSTVARGDVGIGTFYPDTSCLTTHLSPFRSHDST